MRRGHGHPDDEGGAAAVEFGLLFVPFILIVLGILQYGFYFWVAESTNSAARETARRIVVGSCWDDAAAYAAAHGIKITGTTVNPAPDTLDVGQTVTVTVVADGDILDFFPLPDSVTRAYEARMEVDAEATGGCL